MIALLLATAAATAAPAAIDDPDVRCLTAYLVAVGDAGDDASVSAEDKAGLQAIVMYFFGKLDAKRPGADIRGEVTELVGSQGYMAALRPDIERCSAEVETRANYLSSFGEAAESGAAQR